LEPFILFDAVLLDPLFAAVVFVGQKLARHGDLDSVPLGTRHALDFHVEIDGRHDAVSELLFD
jgi:hypothetical protein